MQAATMPVPSSTVEKMANSVVTPDVPNQLLGLPIELLNSVDMSLTEKVIGVAKCRNKRNPDDGCSASSSDGVSAAVCFI